MSFKSDLWNSFPLIQNDFSIKFNQLKCLLEIFHYLCKVETKFAREMKKIFDLKNSVEIEGSLSNSLNEFFKSLEDISIIYKEHADTINETLINPLRKFMINQLELTENLFKEAYSNENKVFEKERKLDLIKEEYHTNCFHLVNATISFEHTISKLQISVEEMNKAKHEQLDACEKVNTSKIKYLKYLEQTNAFKEYQNSLIERNLNDAQSYYLSLIKIFSWIFVTTETFNKDLIEQLRISNGKRLSMYHSINAQDCLNEFINNNISTSYPYHHYDFVCYRIDKNLFEKVELPSKTLENIKMDLNNKFKYVESFISDLSVETKSAISDFIKKAWDGIIDIDNDKKTEFLSLLKENKSNRLYLLSIINTFRTYGLFRISEKTYSLLIDIFKVILDYCNTTSDYSIIQSVIIISQTYYTEEESHSQASRKELQVDLIDHPIFKKKMVWEGIIKNSINEEMYKKWNLYNHSIEERSKNIKCLVKIILMTYLFNMELFKVSQDIIEEIINYFCKSYKISEKLFSVQEKEIKSFEDQSKQICFDNFNNNLNSKDEKNEDKGPNINSNDAIEGKIMINKSLSNENENKITLIDND